MNKVDKISIIMSTYNESIHELEQSVNSIIEQTYKNIEFIIVNDNPQNQNIKDFLDNIKDERVIILNNKKNIGLVQSLNKALSYASGKYIARMDADDVAFPQRLEMQLDYLESKDLDFVGCDVQIIDEKNTVIQERMHFPTDEKKIFKCLPWGNCIAHPTWLLKSEIYRRLDGYRNAVYCEDYDFLLRAISTGRYHFGNMPKIGLKYRIRSSSISRSYIEDQYILRMFLSKNRKNILALSVTDISKYRESKEYKTNLNQYKKFNAIRKSFKRKKSFTLLLSLLVNKYFYMYLIEKMWLKWREKC